MIRTVLTKSIYAVFFEIVFRSAEITSIHAIKERDFGGAKYDFPT